MQAWHWTILQWHPLKYRRTECEVTHSIQEERGWSVRYLQTGNDESIKTSAWIVGEHEWTGIQQEEDWEEGKTLEGEIKILRNKLVFLKIVQGI